MIPAKKNIEHRQDIQVLVDNFYEKVKVDELLGPVFAGLDWPHHLPTMYNFWSSMLLGDQSYRGNPFEKHVRLAITSEHFTRWLQLFKATVDEFFIGEKAEEAKMRADSIAGIFQLKMGLTS
jgi:hemoglobin